MKRVLNTSSEYISEVFEIVVVGDVGYISSATILNTQSSEFMDFENDILDVFDIRDYDLEKVYSSNVKGSVSQYYIFTKSNNDQVLRILVKLRISDHQASERDGRASKELSDRYVKSLAKSIAKERYNQDKGYRPRSVDIIFDDDHYTSYEQALRAIEARLDQFDR